MIIDLYPREEAILRWLARGWSYKQIRELLKIRSECLHSHCQHIRQKTGILDTKDPQQCKDYLQKKSRRPPPKPWLKPTPTMLMAMRGVAEGYSYTHLAKGFGICAQAIQNAVSQGCCRAAIVGQGGNRTQAIRDYLLRLDSQKPLNGDPMF